MKRVAAEGMKLGAFNFVAMYAKCKKIMIQKGIGGKKRIQEDWVNVCFRILKNTAGVNFSRFSPHNIALDLILDAPKILLFLSYETQEVPIYQGSKF